MGFIKFIFKIIWWLFVIAIVGLVGFFGFLIIAENFDTYPVWLQWTLMVPVILFMFGIIFIKPLIVLFAVFKGKEYLEKEEEPTEYEEYSRIDAELEELRQLEAEKEARLQYLREKYKELNRG